MTWTQFMMFSGGIVLIAGSFAAEGNHIITRLVLGVLGGFLCATVIAELR